MIPSFIALSRKVPPAARPSADLRAAGDKARDLRRWGEAVKLYRAYLRESPDDFDIWVQCGHAEKESGDFDAALQCYLEAQRLRGDDPDLHLQLGHLYKLMDREGDAIASYQKCLELTSESADAERELAGLLRAVEAPEPIYLEEPSAAEFAGPAFEVPADVLRSEDELKARIAAETETGDALAVALLTRAYVRLSATEPARWRALAMALEQIGDESQARRCMAIAAALGGDG
jgi:tetratricopeptide (TPR) repeat protein